MFPKFNFETEKRWERKNRDLEKICFHTLKRFHTTPNFLSNLEFRFFVFLIQLETIGSKFWHISVNYDWCKARFWRSKMLFYLARTSHTDEVNLLFVFFECSCFVSEKNFDLRKLFKFKFPSADRLCSSSSKIVFFSIIQYLQKLPKNFSIFFI